MTLPKRIREKVAEVGPLYALQTLKWRLIPSRTLDVNRWAVSTHEIQRFARLKEHDPAIRWATSDDIPQLIECGVKFEKLMVNFGRTLEIAIYEIGGRIIAYSQYAISSWDQDDWLTFEFDRSDIFGAGMWVAPEFRGRGIAPQIMSFAWSHFARNGFRRTIDITNSLNKNSLRAAQKLGPAHIDEFFYARLFGLTFYRYRTEGTIGRWNPSNRKRIGLDLPRSTAIRDADDGGVGAPFGQMDQVWRSI